MRLRDVATCVLIGLVMSAPPVRAQGDAARIVATVGDRVLRMEEVEARRRAQDPAAFIAVEQQVRDARQRALDELIAGALLERHAREGGVTVEQILAQVDAGIVPPTSAEVEATHRVSAAARQGVPLSAVASAIEAYLRQQKVSEERRRFVARIKEEYPVRILASFEAPRQVIVRTASDVVRGPESAAVEIVEFSDFECPYCRQIAPVMNRLATAYGARVRLVWKHYPLSMHPHARAAAEASM